MANTELIFTELTIEIMISGLCFYPKIMTNAFFKSLHFPEYSVTAVAFIYQLRWDTHTYKIQRSRLLFRIVCVNTTFGVADVNELNINAYCNKFWNHFDQRSFDDNRLTMTDLMLHDQKLSFVQTQIFDKTARRNEN